MIHLMDFNQAAPAGQSRCGAEVDPAALRTQCWPNAVFGKQLLARQTPSRSADQVGAMFAGGAAE